MDFLVNEIVIADDSFRRFGFEEEHIVVANLRINSPELTEIRNRICEETQRLIPIELIPDFSFA